MRTYCKVLKLHIWRKSDDASANGVKTLILNFGGYTYKADIDFASLPTYSKDSTDTPLTLTISITRAMSLPVLDWPNEPVMQGLKYPSPHYVYEKWFDDLVIKTEVIEADGLVPDTHVGDTV